MSVALPAKAPFDLKSTAWTLTALRLYTADAAVLCQALDERFSDTPGLFDNDPLVLDLSPLRDSGAVPDFALLLPKLRAHQLVPIAVQGGTPAQNAAASAAGLVEALDAAAQPVAVPAPPHQPGNAGADGAPPQHAPEVVHEVVREVAVVKTVPTMVVDKALRSGQRVYARGGDLVVLAAVSFGAEVIADGHIHVYGPLRGRAMAGARGDVNARIFSTCLEPQLVAIAGIYRTSENELPANVAGKAAQVRLDGERLLLEPLAG